MHAYLVTGSGPEERTEWAENFLKTSDIPEIIRIGHPIKNHVIKTVRELAHSLSFSPLDSKHGRGVLIEDAHLLTTEAGNAFLKTLEEPIGNTTLILTAPNREAVLPTIASRTMHVDLGTANVRIGEEEKEEASSILVKLLKAEMGEKFLFVETLNKRDDALNFCVGQTFAAREMLRKKINKFDSRKLEITENWKGGNSAPRRSEIGNSPSIPQLTTLITDLEQARQDLEANVNVKLAITELLLRYPRAVR